jgi:hypothetical protein
MADKNVNVDKDFQDLFLKSPLGPKVLGMIVDEVGLLDIASGPQQQIAQDQVKTILSHTGIGLGMSGEQYVRALAKGKLEIFEDEDDGS